MDDLMPIGEFSERSRISPKRLRTYAANGLLIPAAVDAASGYRYYAPGQLREAALIDALRGAGLPLVDVAVVLREPSLDLLDDWSKRLETNAAQRRRALARARLLLAEAALPFPTAHRSPYEPKGQAMQLHAASRTETGPVRENNEDALLGGDRLIGVADGMGGAPGGTTAARIAVSVLQAAFTGRSIDELSAAVRSANRAIWERARGTAEMEGMGTTVCVVGLVDDGTLAVVNVGDSRAYLWHDGCLSQLTEDHTVPAELVRRGELTEQEAAQHPHRSVLTRALGVGPDVDIDTQTHRAAAGDRLLLCTDGLFNEVAPDEIEAAMSAGRDVEQCADILVELALSRGARDNVSVVVARIAG